MPSYEQRGKNKLWSVCFREFDLDTNEEKRMRLSGYKTKREAQAAYHDHLTEYEKEKALRASINAKNPQLELTFGQLADLYFESLRTGARTSSMVTFRSKYNSNVREYFEDKKVCEITPKDIVDWQNILLDKDYKYNYLRALREFFNSVWLFGERTYDIKNIARKVKGFRNLNPTNKKPKVWTKEEVKEFLNAVEDDGFRLFFKTMYVTGCRRGEIFALAWEDIDEEQSVIHITKSLSRKKKPWAVTPPKNEQSIRDIRVDRGLVAELKAHAKKRGWTNPFLFGKEDKPYAERTTERAMWDAIEKADLPPRTMHCLRHSCASHLISQGVSIVAVSQRLGHKDIRETLNTYAHMMPNDVEKMVELMTI